MQGLSRLTARVSAAHLVLQVNRNHLRGKGSSHFIFSEVVSSCQRRRNPDWRRKTENKKNKRNKGAVFSRAVWDTRVLKKHGDLLRRCRRKEENAEKTTSPWKQVQWKHQHRLSDRAALRCPKPFYSDAALSSHRSMGVAVGWIGGGGLQRFRDMIMEERVSLPTDVSGCDPITAGKGCCSTDKS